MAKISVIIPVYNTQKYLRECLDSVVNQTLTDIEIICVDDGSTDNSINILNEYKEQDSRIKVLTQRNTGAAVARNNGILHATGEYLYFTDSDDYISHSLLEKMYNKVKEKNADICICKRTIFDAIKNTYRDSDESLLVDILPSDNFNVFDIPNNIFQICVIDTFSKVFRREFIQQNNIEFQSLSSCNDVFFNLSALVSAQIITFIDEPLATAVRFRDGSITSTRGKRISNIVLAAKKVKEYLEKKELYALVSDSFYRRMVEQFFIEIYACNDREIRKIFNREVSEFLPTKYLNMYKKKIFKLRIKRIIKSFFSITNVFENNEKYKKITILGLSYKFKVNKRS